MKPSTLGYIVAGVWAGSCVLNLLFGNIPAAMASFGATMLALELVSIKKSKE